MKTILVRHLKAAFTLLELMLVIAIITLLIGLLFAGIRSARKSAKAAQAAAMISTIVSMSNGYFTTYGYWPMPIGGTAGSYTIVNSGSFFVNCMTANHGTLNPRAIRFGDFAQSSLINPSTASIIQLVDPYGKNTVSGGASYTLYSIYYDTNGDGFVSVSDNGAPAGFPATGSISRPITVWSWGPDRLNDWGTYDSHTSWK